MQNLEWFDPSDHSEDAYTIGQGQLLIGPFRFLEQNPDCEVSIKLQPRIGAVYQDPPTDYPNLIDYQSVGLDEGGNTVYNVYVETNDLSLDFYQ